MTFTKLFSSITASTIWQEDDQTRIVWITMLAMSNKNGFVFASVPGLASMAKVSLSATLKALEKFQQPDEYSRTKDFGGRRIKIIDGGWFLLNYQKHRAIRDEEERKEYMKSYMREYRRKSVNTSVNNVSNVNSSEPSKPALAQAEADSRGRSTSRGENLKDSKRGDVGKSDSVPTNGSPTPSGLNELQYAARLMEEIKMPNTRHNLEQVAAGIKSEASSHGGLNHAYDFVLTQAKAEIELKGRVTGFWFQDAKWRTKKPKAHDPFESLARVKEQQRKAIEKVSQ